MGTFIFRVLRCFEGFGNGGRVGGMREKFQDCKPVCEYAFISVIIFLLILLLLLLLLCFYADIVCSESISSMH